MSLIDLDYRHVNQPGKRSHREAWGLGSRRRADFSEEFPEDGQGDEIEEWDQENRGDGPGLDAVEGGDSEIAGELGGIVLEAGEELGDGEADGRDAVEVLAEADEDKDQREVERVGEGLEEVEDGLVQAEQVADCEAHKGSAAHDGKDAKRQPQGHAPCELLRAGALPELVRDGADDPAVEAGWRVLGHREIICIIPCWKKPQSKDPNCSAG